MFLKSGTTMQKYCISCHRSSLTTLAFCTLFLSYFTNKNENFVFPNYVIYFIFANFHEWNRITYHIAIFMFLCFNGKLPNFLANSFCLNMDIHDYNTRNALDYQYPRIRTTSMRNSVFVKGPEVWNSLPTEIKSSQSLDVFKYKYKRFLLHMYQVP